MKYESMYERMQRLGVDLSWLERAREQREKQQEFVIRRKQPVHALKLVYVSAGPVGDTRAYFLVRVCPACKVGSVADLCRTHGDHPLVKNSQIDIVSELPATCVGQKEVAHA